MPQFLLSTLYPVLLLFRYLPWAQRRIDLQIEKMQEASFNTPGAEAPIPPEVVLGGLTLVAGHFLVGRGMLRMKWVPTVLSLFLGGLLGTVLFFSTRADD